MNLTQINAIRTSAGLVPLAANPKTGDAKKRQAANQALRAQESRDLKALRGSGRKAK